MGAAVKLTQAQKAAAILVAMGKPSAGRLLKFFKQEELKALVEAARVLRTIPQAELEKVVEEFEHEFTEGAGLLDSADSMDTILSESLSPEEISVLMGRSKPALSREEVWAELEKVEPARLAQLLEREHPQTAAVILAQMAPKTASKVILVLGKARRGDVMRRMAALGQVPPAARALIEKRIAEILRAEAGGKDASAGQARVASVLNEMDKAEVDELIGDLEAAGAEDIEAIRARLFSFEEIVDLPHKARVALFDGLATDLVTLALRNAPQELVEAALSALGQRSRRMIEAELAMPADGIPAEDIAQAQRRIAATAVELSQKGLFDLPSAQKAA
ncbi:flagellar motor switch protein FliG [Chelativorans intermedius]|uniref:Flagellar motor switch protein FliG n=1 Tax=Chelativorans intermedius TaxID=515947 RepID=A0ABV6D8T5_9HYPH|nr:flagellar motor switch protein FliG [Chelativorans intermedius]MCT8997797.1 flagellar motor switch protein FliG [Chelativorans intermedius]